MTVVNGDDIVYQDRPTRLSANPFASFSRGESSAREVILQSVPQRTPHRHPHSEEIVFVAEGRGEVWIDGVRHPVQAGSWVRVPAGTPHATMAAPGQRMKLICFFPHNDLEQNIEELDLLLDAPEEEKHE